MAVGLDLEKRVGRQKAVASDLLTAHNAFEEAGAAARVDLVEGADRGQRIADQAAIDGHQLAVGGQLAKGLEVGTMDRRRARMSVGRGMLAPAGFALSA